MNRHTHTSAHLMNLGAQATRSREKVQGPACFHRLDVSCDGQTCIYRCVRVPPVNVQSVVQDATTAAIVPCQVPIGMVQEADRRLFVRCGSQLVHKVGSVVDQGIGHTGRQLSRIPRFSIGRHVPQCDRDCTVPLHWRGSNLEYFVEKSL
jgi:hypothetical protein